MSERTDLYSVLGVKRSASQDEIKRAYRRLAKKHHPDRNPSDASAEGRFKEVQRAYDTLSDAEKRSQYDQFGDAGVGQVHTNQRGRNVYQWGGGSSVDIDDLQDLMGAFGGGGRASIFNDIFGRPQRPQVPSRGTDEEHRIALSFDQAIHGATVTVQLRRGPNGKPETLEVKVPPGVEDQQRIRLRSKGNPGARGGPPGDLLLVCSIQPHPYFTRRGADIHLDLPVSVIEAVLGARIDVPSIDGAATVTLPPGTPGGTRLRLVGRGVRKQGKDERGDQYITVRIVPPKTLTKEDRSHYEALKKLEQSDPRSQCGWAQGA